MLEKDRAARVALHPDGQSGKQRAQHYYGHGRQHYVHGPLDICCRRVDVGSRDAHQRLADHIELTSGGKSHSVDVGSKKQSATQFIGQAHEPGELDPVGHRTRRHDEVAYGMFVAVSQQLAAVKHPVVPAERISGSVVRQAQKSRDIDSHALTQRVDAAGQRGRIGVGAYHDGRIGVVAVVNGPHNQAGNQKTACIHTGEYQS